MVTSRTTGPVMGRPSTCKWQTQARKSKEELGSHSEPGATRGSRDGEEREDARALASKH